MNTIYYGHVAGLVPKHGGQCRLIFHLSWPENASINHYTPEELCTTCYNDFDIAVRLCIKAGKGAKMAKSDLKSGGYISY